MRDLHAFFDVAQSGGMAKAAGSVFDAKYLLQSHFVVQHAPMEPVCAASEDDKWATQASCCKHCRCDGTVKPRSAPALAARPQEGLPWHLKTAARRPGAGKSLLDASGQRIDPPPPADSANGSRQRTKESEMKYGVGHL